MNEIIIRYKTETIQEKTTKVGKINTPKYKGTTTIRNTTIIPKPDRKELYQIFQKINFLIWLRKQRNTLK